MNIIQIHVDRLPDWDICNIMSASNGYEVEATYRPQPAACLHCQSCDLVRVGVYRHRIKDAPINNHPVTIVASRPRYKCRECGRTILPVCSELIARSNMTVRLRDYIKSHCRDCKHTAMAHLLGLTEARIRQICKGENVTGGIHQRRATPCAASRVSIRAVPVK